MVIDMRVIFLIIQRVREMVEVKFQRDDPRFDVVLKML